MDEKDLYQKIQQAFPVQTKAMEIAKTIGQPVDPEKPLNIEWMDKICEYVSFESEEHSYYMDTVSETKKVVTMDSTGQIVQEDASPDSEHALTFVDLESPEYIIKLASVLVKSDKSLYARKRKTIEEAMNREEARRTIALLASAASTASHQQGKVSGETKLTMGVVFAMRADVVDYADDLVMICGTTVDNDRVRMEYDENKYHSVKDAFDTLGITPYRVPWSVSVGTQSVSTTSYSATAVLTATKAYLVGTRAQGGKPLFFCRKVLNAANILGYPIMKDEEGNKRERIILTSVVPVTKPGDARYRGIGVSGYEQIATAVRNAYAVSEFDRTS